MRALWIEDHQLIGQALEMLLHVVMPDLSLDMAPDLESALPLAQAVPYQLVLLDWWLGGHDGASAIHELRAISADVPIIVVSGDDREPVMRQAFALGAAGYVPKSADPAALVEAIRVALAGRVSHPRWPRHDAASPGHLGVVHALDLQTVFPELTPRQADVFRALMRGLCDKQIARDLDISDTTVKSHVRAILETVGVHKRTQAVWEALRRGAGDH